ncbi:MAG: hypothetical protein IKG85_10890 [Clostridia bacterium]|nr:hypothetical protein [Clostridia bacterium]
MKRYTDPEMEIVSFDINDVTNTDHRVGDDNEWSFKNGDNSIQINW